jgi:invasion protein IalB
MTAPSISARAIATGFAAVAVYAAGMSAATAQSAAAPTAVETGRFGDWIVHQSAGTGSKICFAASQPRAKEPATANRSKIVLYISAWPKEGVKAEISIKMGYPVKAGSTVAVTVGTDAFTLFGKEDRAYVADATEELKLIDAMKKGSKLTVQGSSEKGTVTTDTYSLSGLGQAMQALAAACP